MLTGLAGNLWTAHNAGADRHRQFRELHTDDGDDFRLVCAAPAGMASGVLVAGSGVALLVTGFLVPRIISASPLYGWRISWYVLGMIVVLLGLFIYLLLRNKPSDLGLKPVGAECEAAGTACAGADSSTAGTEVEKDGAGAGWKNIYGSRTLWLLGLVYFAFGFSYIIYATFFSTRWWLIRASARGKPVPCGRWLV